MPEIPIESNSYNKQNDYEIFKLEIVSNMGGSPVDIMPQFIELVIYETIFDSKMVGELTILDCLNYSENIPIVGNETLIISYKTKGADFPIEIIGKVFTILGKSRTSNEKAEVYKLQFVTVNQYYNNMKKLCCSKSGTIDKIATSIFRENFGETSKFDIDVSDPRTFRFVFPYWSPLYALTWLSQRAISPGSPQLGIPSCYVFYEGVDGFHFVDLMRRSVLPTSMTYRYEPNNPTNQSNVNSYFEKVQDYNVSSYFDRLMEYKTGMYSGTLMTHDITKKKIGYHEFDYHKSFNSSRHINEKGLIPSADKTLVDSKLGFMNYMPIQSDKYEGIKNNDTPKDYYLNRASLLRQFNTIKLSLLVNGNSTLRLLDIVNFEIPKVGYLDVDEKDWEDQYLSGRYLIVSIKHMINREVGYNTSLELAKDSLIKGIPDRYE